MAHDERSAAQLEADADAHYEAQDQEWFNRLPLEDLTYLWSICCTTVGAAWDDEVYEALFARDFFKVS